MDQLLLVLPGVSLSTADQEGLTALSWACLKSQKGTAKLLVEAGADLNLPDRQGRTPLDMAALNGDAETVGLKIQKKKIIMIKMSFEMSMSYICFPELI